MTPKDLSGITYIEPDGTQKPIVEKVREQEEIQKQAEAGKVGEEIKRAHRSSLYRSPALGNVVYQNDYKGRVATRVRHLTPDEIRREKGIRMKTLGSIYADILWVIREKSLTTGNRVTPGEIAIELGKPLEKLTPMVIYTWKKIAVTQVVDRVLEKGTYAYKWVDPLISVEQAMALAKAARKGHVIVDAPPADPPPQPPAPENLEAPAEPSAVKLDSQAIMDFLKTFGVTVKVTGNIGIWINIKHERTE